jgi:hypothetical protein
MYLYVDGMVEVLEILRMEHKDVGIKYYSRVENVDDEIIGRWINIRLRQ